MKYKFFLVSLLVGAMLMGFSVASNAATLTVPSTTYANIAAAMAADADGDIISIAAGSYAEDITVDKDVTIKCSTVAGIVTLTGAALDASTITMAAGSTGATLQNITVNISANASKVTTTNPAVAVATGINNVTVYNCTFNTGAKATTAIGFAGAASGWQIEACTFTISTTGNIGIAFNGAGAIASMDILGNTFNGINGTYNWDGDLLTPGAVTDARMLLSKAAVTSLTGLNVTGNVVNKATLQINSAASVPSNEVINSITITSNQFTESNAILFQSTNAGDVATTSAGTSVAGILAAAGDILIKGNHFGSTATNGNQLYAVKFSNWVSADVNESNIHINYNNIQYPMTSTTDLGTNLGHITATNGVGVQSNLAAIDAKFNWWGTLTGYNTSYQDGGNGVVNLSFDGTNFISSYVVPQVDETNRGVELYDWDGNGKLDRAVVFFDYYLDPASVQSYGGWAVAGYTFNTARLPRLGLDNSGGGSSDGPYALTLFLTEGSAMDTGIKPATTYTKSTGYVASISGNVNAKLNDVLDATATEHDKAKPVIMTAVTGDANTNGKIDKITVTFSEAITLSAPSGGTIDITDWDNNVTIPSGGGYALNANLSSATGAVLTLILSEVTYDTDIKPTVGIAVDGSDDYKDIANNVMVAVTSQASTDGAAPVAYAVNTEDYGTSDRGVGLPDGYIDGFYITFSEPGVTIAAADSAAARNAFAVSTVENAIDLKTALISVSTTFMTIKGQSMKTASTAYGSHPWDTDKLPTLTYTSAAGIKDAAGNAWVTFWKPTAAAAATVFSEVTDGADPIIVKAVGQVASKNIYLTFSEGVKGTGAVNTIAAGDLAYVNVYNTGANATALAATIVDNDATSQTAPTAQVTTDFNLLDFDVSSDSIKVETLGDIKDLSTAANNLVVRNYTINDIIPPTIIAAVTQDVDNDGWIDHIKITFDETIDNAALTGYNGTDKISLSAATNWAVTGYTVIGLNFVSSAAEQTTATTDATTRAIAFAADATGKVINVSDDPSGVDNILWLMVQEGSGTDKTAGDTNAVPSFTITGGTAANVADYKPNRIATTTMTPTDNAGAAIMSARMTGTMSMEVIFSETVADTLISTGTPATVSGAQLIGTDFTMFFGEGYVNLGIPSIIKDTSQVAGVVQMSWPNTIVPAGETGVIGLSGAGVVLDMTNFGNTQVYTLANGAGQKVISAYIEGGGVPTNIAKAALSAVPSNQPDISNKNVTRVYFAGTAAANDSVAAKLVDKLGTGTSTTATRVKADANGYFSGTINASTLANGQVTLKAGKIDNATGAVAWQTFTDYLKETLVIGAPSGVAVTDVPNDQGGFVNITFKKSAQDRYDAVVKNPSDYYVVDYYVLQVKRSAYLTTTADTEWQTVAMLMPDGSADSTYRAIGVWVGSQPVSTTVRLNAHTMFSPAKAAGASDLPGEMSSAYAYVYGVNVIDNVSPGNFTKIAADGTTGEGVVVTWSVPLDHLLVNAQYNVWGVDGYDVYRRLHGSSDPAVKVNLNSIVPTSGAWTPSGANFTYTDHVQNGSTVYDYLITATDGPAADPQKQVTYSPSVTKVMAAKGADFNGNNKVDGGDLVLLGSKWNLKTADAGFVSNYDLNHNGTIDGGDLVLLGSAWGTTGKVAKEALPVTSDVALTMGANYDGKSSIYYVNIAANKVDGLNGVGFTMSYDADALELVKDGITGLGEVSITKQDEAGIVDVFSYFMDKEFTGTITVAFQSKGMSKELDFELIDASVSINNVINAVNAARISVPAVPTVYSLNQNFPNPFNPTTTIEYSIPEAGNVNLVIYNLAGQKVRTLVNENQPASFKKVVWDGRNDRGETVGAGMYFYKLVSGNFTKIQKMTLIK